MLLEKYCVQIKGGKFAVKYARTTYINIVFFVLRHYILSHSVACRASSSDKRQHLFVSAVVLYARSEGRPTAP